MKTKDSILENFVKLIRHTNKNIKYFPHNRDFINTFEYQNINLSSESIGRLKSLNCLKFFIPELNSENIHNLYQLVDLYNYLNGFIPERFQTESYYFNGSIRKYSVESDYQIPECKIKNNTPMEYTKQDVTSNDTMEDKTISKCKCASIYGNTRHKNKYVKIPFSEIRTTPQFYGLSDKAKLILEEMIFKSGNDCNPIDFSYAVCDTPCSKNAFYSAIKEITKIGYFDIEKKYSKKAKKLTNHFVATDRYKNNHAFDAEYKKYIMEKMALIAKDRAKI